MFKGNSRASRLACALATLAVALVPLYLAQAANPAQGFDNYPCAWSFRAGATGNGVLNHPFVETYGSCYAWLVKQASFKGSDSNWYIYYGQWDYSPTTAEIHFCQNHLTGTGTCWWADNALGQHQVEVFPAIYSSVRFTSAQCVGC